MTNKCNYKCKFCFGNLRNMNCELNANRILEIPPLLAEAGCKKISFEGGEPFLSPHLGELLKISKEVDLTTSIISNGSLITEAKLSKLAKYLDWLGLSVDSSYENIEKKLGRGNGGHIKSTRRVVDLVHRFGIHLKLNTVVTSLNYQEDMTDFVLHLRPERWKVFQMLQIEGENTLQAETLAISKEQFQVFINKNKRVAQHGVDFVAESQDDMKGSYIMLLPDGIFFSNHGGRHVFGSHSVFDVGVSDALAEVGWDEAKFQQRGGMYNWDLPKNSKEVILSEKRE